MTRVQFPNTNQRPLADTALGAAGEVTGTERAQVQGATAVNTASAVVKRDASGNFAAGTMTGTATAANALNVGTTDGDKLHGIGAELGLALVGTPSLTGSFATLVSLPLTAGVWVVSGKLTAEAGALSSGLPAVVISRVMYNTIAMDQAYDVLDASGQDVSVTNGMVVATGPTTVTLDARVTNTPVVAIGTLGGAYLTYLRAVRVG